jgi:PPIC-type PPIASE domain
MKSLIREPLAHFVLLGAAIFAAYSLVSKHTSGEPGTIVVSQGQLASMWEGFTTTRQRPPTGDEWEGLIRARVRQEVYYREALALSLDKDDAIIRRRLQQKMEFVSDDAAAQRQPTDAELNAYLQAHADQFRAAPRFTFYQLFLDREKHGKNLARDAALLLAQVNHAGAGTDVSALGDTFMLGGRFDVLPAGEVARTFGDAFAKQLSGLSPGRWHGPIESSFGLHLVFVSERGEARAPVLTEVRDAVRREWDDAQRLEGKEKLYQEMLKRYAVTVEHLEPPPTVASLGER